MKKLLLSIALITLTTGCFSSKPDSHADQVNHVQKQLNNHRASGLGASIEESTAELKAEGIKSACREIESDLCYAKVEAGYNWLESK